MWIKEYRDREGLELWQLQQRVNDFARNMFNPIKACISGELIHMLEVDENAVTHPRIANVIATICNASTYQRDMIVHKKHRGLWNGPTDEDMELADSIRKKWDIIDDENGDKKKRDIKDYMAVMQDEQEKKKRRKPKSNARAVVKLDRYGNIHARYQSIGQACEAEGVNKGVIQTRCYRRIRKEFGVNEYDRHHGKLPAMEYTYRFANEWDSMSTGQKMLDIQRTIR